MSELSMFERRLAASLEAYAGPRRDVDAIAIARTAANAERSRGSATLSIRSRRNVALLVAAALTAVLFVGGALAVGSGLVRLSSISCHHHHRRCSHRRPPRNRPPRARRLRARARGPLGGGLILVHDLPRSGDRSVHDVVALDAGTGVRTQLGTLPGTDASSYVFQRNADRNQVLILTNDGDQGVVSNLQAPTEASLPFGFITNATSTTGRARAVAARRPNRRHRRPRSPHCDRHLRCRAQESRISRCHPASEGSGGPD